VFTAASLACGLAGTPGVLIAFRLVQGAGAALMIPQVFSLIQRQYQGRARARALSRYAAVIAGGAIVGQVLGGVLVTADLWGTGWRPVFLINVPIGSGAAAGRRPGAARRPRRARARTRPARPVHPLACRAAVRGTAGVRPRGALAPVGWISLAGSVVMLAAFVAVERRADAR